MKPRFMQLPRSVLVREGALNDVNIICSDLGLSGKALVISDANTYNVAGKKVSEVLSEEHEVEVEKIDDATFDEVKRISGKSKEVGATFVLGVGGGKVIDVAKLVAKESTVEFISVPTAASHDGIVSSRASLKHSGARASLAARAPLGVIADTEIIRKSPYRLTASGCGDIISKFTAVKDWELARDKNGEEFSEYASALSLMSAKIIADSSDTINDGSETSIRKVVKALISCGVAMSIAGSSRPGSGSEHKFSHALDAISPKPAFHGEQCGVGTIMMTKLQGGDWEHIRGVLRDIDAPVDANGLGIDSDLIVEALTKAHEIRKSRYTILDDGLTRNQAVELASSTMVI